MSLNFRSAIIYLAVDLLGLELGFLSYLIQINPFYIHSRGHNPILQEYFDKPIRKMWESKDSAIIENLIEILDEHDRWKLLKANMVDHIPNL